MREYEIRQYLEETSSSQTDLAKKLGTTQSAVSQMLADERNIFIRVADNGDVSAYEIRTIPSRKPQAA